MPVGVPEPPVPACTLAVKVTDCVVVVGLGVALGRNRFIAWGATNVAADVEDLYRERLDAAGTHYEFRGAQEPITVIPEAIVVKGAAPVSLRVRVTRHGPLVSDAINATSASNKATAPKVMGSLAFTSNKNFVNSRVRAKAVPRPMTAPTITSNIA